MKGENYGYLDLEHSINRRGCCHPCCGTDNEKNEIVKPAKHLQ